MAVWFSCFEACTFPSGQFVFAVVVNQTHRSLNKNNELVFIFVPMAKRGCCAGPKQDTVDARLCQSCRTTSGDACIAFCHFIQDEWVGSAGSEMYLTSYSFVFFSSEQTDSYPCETGLYHKV
jgi:hypothetical protein